MAEFFNENGLLILTVISAIIWAIRKEGQQNLLKLRVKVLEDNHSEFSSAIKDISEIKTDISWIKRKLTNQ